MRLILDKHRLFSISLLSHVAKLTISVSSHSHIAFKQHAKGGFFFGGGGGRAKRLEIQAIISDEHFWVAVS